MCSREIEAEPYFESVALTRNKDHVPEIIMLGQGTGFKHFVYVMVWIPWQMNQNKFVSSLTLGKFLNSCQPLLLLMKKKMKFCMITEFVNI